LDYTVRDERLAYVLYQKAISRQLKQVAVVWSAGSGRLPRFQFHWSNAAIHANQIVRPTAESVPCGNERWRLIDGSDRCMPDPYRQKAGLRKPAAPQQPCQYRNDERNRNEHLISPFSWGAW
jgi:hypothetical protein